MLDGTELKGPKETGEMCPLCGDKKGKNGGGKLVVRERRDGSGTFISCSRYPKCKFIKKMKQKKPKRKQVLFVRFVKKEKFQNDVAALEFFILVQIIRIANLQ